MVTIDGKMYVVDPKRYGRIAYRPWRFLKLSVEYMWVQMWRENDPDPIDFHAASNPGSAGISSSIMAQLARSERLRRLVSPGVDWLLIILLFSIFANIVLGLILYVTTSQ